MDVQLLVTEAVGVTPARELAHLGAEDVAIEGVGAGGVGHGDDGVVEAQTRQRIASSSGVTSRWNVSISTSGFSASAGMR